MLHSSMDSLKKRRNPGGTAWQFCLASDLGGARASSSQPSLAQKEVLAVYCPKAAIEFGTVLAVPARRLSLDHDSDPRREAVTGGETLLATTT